MSGIMNMFVAAKTTIATAVDAFFNLTTLLLNTSSTNGAQNNTFLDSSTNNFTITRNGNTTQGTFTPFSQTGWGNYFDSNNSYLNFGNQTALHLGSGNFTVEMWVWKNANTAYMTACGDLLTGGTNTFQMFGDATGTKICWYDGATAAFTITSVQSIQLNTWTHIAFVRSSTTLSLYINGILDSTASLSTNYNASTSFFVGYTPELTAGRNWNGYISNFRMVKGTAVYTSAFTPSTTPLTAITNTSLLTCQSNRFLDTSTNAFAITVTGTPSVQAFSPFAPTAAYDAAVVGGSAYFDGTGDYLNGPNAAGADFGTGNFTISFWFYPTVLTGGVNSGIISYADTGGWNGWQLQVRGSTKDILFEFLTGSAGASQIVGGSIALNAWNYVAIVRSGSTVSMYVNSTTAATSTTNSTAYGAAGSRVLVAGDRLLGSLLNGYISNVKLVKQANAPASIPTAPDTNTTNTSLLLNFTNAGIFDSTAKNVLETVGNAQVSTTQAKWGTTSMAFDGTGDYLISNSGTDLYAFGSGNFTIECWVYFNTVASQVVYDGRPSGVQTTQPSIYMSGAGVLFYYVNGANVITGATLTSGQWYHIAVARSGTSTKMFLNGVQTGSTYSDTTVYTNTAGRPVIGNDGFNLTNPLNGYIDDLRVTKGYARYTANFTAPTAAFPLQ
jgi:hypothetical protein